MAELTAIGGAPVQKNNVCFSSHHPDGEWWGLIEMRYQLGCCLRLGWSLSLGYQRREIVPLRMRVLGVGPGGGGLGAKGWSHLDSALFRSKTKGIVITKHIVLHVSADLRVNAKQTEFTIVLYKLRQTDSSH